MSDTETGLNHDDLRDGLDAAFKTALRNVESPEASAKDVDAMVKLVKAAESSPLLSARAPSYSKTIKESGALPEHLLNRIRQN